MRNITIPRDWDPSVSIILATRDRPDFIRVAIECFRRQTYQNIELIIVDNGDQHTLDQRLVEGSRVRLIRVDSSLSLGDSLNLGVRAATGLLCFKVDDDDWYGSAFIEIWVDRVMHEWNLATKPIVLVPVGFLLLDVKDWAIRTAPPGQFAGAAMCFLREDALASPFRPYSQYEDVNFYLDLILNRGAAPLAIETPEEFIAIRHGSVGTNRGHTWLAIQEKMVEDELRDRPDYPRTPEQLIDSWALPFYRSIHTSSNEVEVRSE